MTLEVWLEARRPVGLVVLAAEHCGGCHALGAFVAGTDVTVGSGHKPVETYAGLPERAGIPGRQARMVVVRDCSRWQGWKSSGVEGQAAFLGSVHHPQQRDVGQRRVVIAASDTAVDAGEPDLF